MLQGVTSTGSGVSAGHCFITLIEVTRDRKPKHPYIRAFSSQTSCGTRFDRLFLGGIRARRWCGGAVVVRWWCGGDAAVRWWCGDVVAEAEKNSADFRVEWNRLNFAGVVPIDELSSDHGSFAQHKSRRNREVQIQTNEEA